MLTCSSEQLQRKKLSTGKDLANSHRRKYPLFMVTKRDIRDFVQRVADEFSPEQVVLFGSYARGTPTEDSDVDLLVVMPHNKRNVEQSLDITRRVDRTFPLDLIVRKPNEIRDRLRQHDMFLTSILEQGTTLYERAHRRMGTKG